MKKVNARKFMLRIVFPAVSFMVLSACASANTQTAWTGMQNGLNENIYAGPPSIGDY